MNKNRLVRMSIYTGFSFGMLFSAMLYDDATMIFFHLGICIIQVKLLNSEYRK